MSREIRAPDGITWTCIQAFAGLRADPAKTDAARVEGAPSLVHVVCTPSGGAHSVRVDLPEGWESETADDHLLEAIRSQLAQAE